MGLLKKLFSTAGVIHVSANAYSEKYPFLSFREALERSLIETRPGWNLEVLQRVSPYLDSARTEEEMVNVVANFEKQLKKGI